MAPATTPALNLGNGVTMPALGLGVFQSPPEETATAVETALRDGYRHIDTAAAYGNEREVGEAVRASGLDRSEVFLETKIWISDYGYDATLHGFEKSAGKLGAEQIEVHPYFTQSDVQAFGAEHGILTQAWSPIGGITSARIAENFDVFDFELAGDQMIALDGLDTGRRGGPEPEDITLETYGMPIPEA